MILAAENAVDIAAQYTCGAGSFAFSGMFPYIVSLLVTIIKIVVPILLVIVGLLDLAKSVVASKEDEIKKGYSVFIKRLIAALVVFIVIQVVQIAVRFASQGDETIMGCFSCFINGSTDEGSCELYTA